MSDPMTTVEAELAKAIVLAIVGGLTELVKKVPRLFRRAGTAKQHQASAEIERSAAALAATAGTDQEREMIRQEATWETLFRGLLADHRDLRDEMTELLAELRQHGAGTPKAKTQYVIGHGGTTSGAMDGNVIHHHYSTPPATSAVTDQPDGGVPSR